MGFDAMSCTHITLLVSTAQGIVPAVATVATARGPAAGAAIAAIGLPNPREGVENREPESAVWPY